MDHFNNFNINTTTMQVVSSKSPIKNMETQQQNSTNLMDLSSDKIFPSPSSFTSSNYSLLGDNFQNDQKMNNSDFQNNNNNSSTLLEQKQSLTQAGLEEYDRNYYDSNLSLNHMKQSSYARSESEGYHSYVSSTDSTHYIDRLRKESKLQSRINSWPENMNKNNNVVFTPKFISPETSPPNPKPFKWVDSGSTQLVASSKVHSPQKHRSRSTLMNSDQNLSLSIESSLNKGSDRSDRSKFHINTYESPPAPVTKQKVVSPPAFQSVSQRINELNYQMQLKNLNFSKPKYTYLDPSKTQRVSNTALKTYQKNCLTSYFERQQKSVKTNGEKSNTSLNSLYDENEVTEPRNSSTNESKFNNNQIIIANVKTTDIEAPPPPPRNRPILRRTSSVSESTFRDKVLTSKQHLSRDLHGPMIIGQIISVDEWIPERPPKKSTLFVPKPKVADIDLPPPPPIETSEKTLNFENEPLPPPPKFLTDPEPEQTETVRRNSFAGQCNNSFQFRSLENIMTTPSLPPRTHEFSPVIAKEMPARRSLLNNWNFSQQVLLKTNNLANNNINNNNSNLNLMGANQNEPMLPMKCLPDSRISDARLSIRKRTHNSNDTNINKQNMNNTRHSLHTSAPVEYRQKNLSPEHGHGNHHRATINEFSSNTNNYKEDLVKYPLPDVLPKLIQPPVLHQSVSQEFQPNIAEYHSMRNLQPQTAPIITGSNKSIFQFSNSVQPSQEIKTMFSNDNLNLSQQNLNFRESFAEMNINNGNIHETPINSQYFDEKCDKIATVRKITMVESVPTAEYAQPVQTMESEINCEAEDSSDKPVNNKDENSNVETQLNQCISEMGDLKVDLWTPKNCQEEYDCEKLTKFLVSQLSPSDQLQNILVPKKMYSSSDYISDLFKTDITSRNYHDKLAAKSSFESTTSDKVSSRYNREMTLIQNDAEDLTRKKKPNDGFMQLVTSMVSKEELVARMSKKLLILSNEQTMLIEEQCANDSLGNEVANSVRQKARPVDATKFRGYVEDLGHITLLLLSLSSRLAKIENTLHNSNNLKNEDKKILENKRDKLFEQLKEAKQLKKDIDRRGKIISDILEKLLTAEEFEDFNYFIVMKAKLIIDSREIEEKISLANQQIVALRSTIMSSDC